MPPIAQITTRRKTIAFAVGLTSCSIGLALALNITWVIHWREVGMVVLGLIFFAFIIAVLALNTMFLVREVRRNEQQDSFINAVTHELKTPIASIRLYLETLQSRQLSEDQRKNFYQTMMDDTERLTGTVEQVLRAAQTSQKKTGSQWHATDIGELARECVDLARTRHHLDESAMTFVNQYSGGQETLVYGDSEELRTAILNLLDNAVKYSGSNVKVRADLVSSGSMVELRVTDKGVGIPRTELKRIFRRFYRVPQFVKGRIKGTGLGLFIVKNIASRHGGSSEAYSEGEGKGATVVLRLPRMVR